MPFEFTSNNKSYIKNIQIYENENQFYFIGTHSINKTLLIFTINKLKFNGNSLNTYLLEDILIEHKGEYDKALFDDLIVALSKDPSTSLRLVDEAKAIFGFVKFYFGYYAILASDYSKIGKIGEFIINRVEKLKLLPLFQVSPTNVYLDLESKYLTIFKNFDPSRQVYFSYNYDLTKTLQRNFVENLKKEVVKNFDDNYKIVDEKNKKVFNLKKSTNNTFLWNHFHIKEFYNILENKIWIVNFIYGFIEQVECLNYGLRFLVTVIARRNRHYAGTRYLKRGINDDGNVANDVETEQILEETSTSCAEKPVISSYIHIRGSVPIYWYQEQNSILPKPDIKLNNWDVFYESTKKHFHLLTRRYGAPIIACNLTKKKEKEHKQEELLNDSYSSAVSYINDQLSEEEKITYLHYDIKAERRQAKFYQRFYEISYEFSEKTGMFLFVPHLNTLNTYTLELQSGVIRSNCVDCLDRTNVFKQVIGTAVMVNQLRSMGVNAKSPSNEEEMFGVLTEIYKNMGHELSTQYAGSLAHKQTIKDNRTMVNKLIDKFPEMFNNFKRYFNNSFNDQYKQASINLFLGKYRVCDSSIHLWDLINDSILHRAKFYEKIKDGWMKDGLQYYQTFNLIDDILKIDDDKNNPELFEFVQISKNNSNVYQYRVNLENYPLYKKSKGYKKNLEEIETFYSLGPDQKNKIKNFYQINYNTCYETSTGQSKLNTPVNLKSSFLNDNMVYASPSENGDEERKYNTRTHPVSRRKRDLSQSKRKIKKQEWNYKPNAEDFNEKFVDKPKYDIKITSFEMDANEINLTNEFVDPDPKYLQNSEFHHLDAFINMKIDLENYNNIFDTDFVKLENNFYKDPTYDSVSNEFVEDILQKANNRSHKNKENKMRELSNVDYLIFNVDEKQFYKKITNESNGNNMNNYNQISNPKLLQQTDNSGNEKQREASPKIHVKVKKLPIKIFDDHIC